MEIMEVIKFVEFYGLQIVVVGLVGITILAGLYQLVRGAVKGNEAFPAHSPKA